MKCQLYVMHMVVCALYDTFSHTMQEGSKKGTQQRIQDDEG